MAIAVLKTSWVVPDNERRSQLEKWALDRLNRVPTEGASQLVSFWGAALDTGATQLHGIWRLLEEDARGGAVTQALDSLLETRRTMAPQALRSAAWVGAKHLSHARLLALADAALADPAVTGEQRTIWSFVAFVLDPARHTNRFIAEHGNDDAGALFDKDLIAGLDEALGTIVDVSRLHRDATIIRVLGRTTTPANAGPDSMVGHAINRLAGEPCAEGGVTLLSLVDDPSLTAWRPDLRHAQAQQARLRRDQSFRHPTVSAMRAAISGGPPVNANDLRAVVMEELRELNAELHTAPNTPWKDYWNLKSNGKVDRPLIENQCRNRLLGLLRERLKKYGIVAALPEAQRGEDTRSDLLFLTWAGRNLPLEAKRHFDPDIWVAASTQLQGYSADPGADGFGIYLVFWFGNEASPAPSRPDGRAGPTTAIELEAMLAADLSSDLRRRTGVIVFDVSDPAVAGRRKPRRKRDSKAVSSI